MASIKIAERVMAHSHIGILTEAHRRDHVMANSQLDALYNQNSSDTCNLTNQRLLRTCQMSIQKENYDFQVFKRATRSKFNQLEGSQKHSNS